MKSLSRDFRGMWKERTRLEIICRRRLIAKVLEREEWPGLEVAMEVVPVSADARSGWASERSVIGDGPILVGCRCGRGRHVLEDSSLREMAMQYRPGRPGEVGVSAVDGT